jgi:hypothetical protein
LAEYVARQGPAPRRSRRLQGEPPARIPASVPVRNAPALTGKGGRPLPTPAEVATVLHGGYSFKALPRKMNYTEIARWFGVDAPTYNTWIRMFAPFSTGEKFHVYKTTVKRMRVLHAGTEVPVPAGEKWEAVVAFEKQLQAAPYWRTDRHALDKLDWRPVPLEQYVAEHYDELTRNRQRLLYVLAPRVDKDLGIRKIGTAGNHSSHGKAIGRLRQYLIAFGEQRAGNPWSGVDVYFIKATGYDAKTEPKRSRIFQLELRLKRLIKNSGTGARGRGTERTTASLDQLRTWIDGLLELREPEMRDRPSGVECRTRAQMRTRECQSRFDDADEGDLEI